MAEAEDKKTNKKRGFWSRYGIPVAMIGILGAASLSFVALGMLKRDKPPEEPKNEIVNAVSSPITLPLADGPSTAPPAPPSIPAPTAPATPAAPEESASGTKPEPVKTGKIKLPDSGPPEDLVKPDAEDETTVVTAADTKTDSEGFPNPGSPPVAPPESIPAGDTSEQPLTAAADAEQPPKSAGEETAAAQPPEPKNSITKPAFPSPPEDEKNLSQDEIIPKPLWQTVDQNWEQIKVDESGEPADIGDEGGSWKQLNVGQKDTVTTKPSTIQDAVKPEPVKSADAEKSQPAQKPTKVAAKPKKVYLKPVRKKRYAKKEARPAQTAQLVIINESGKPGQAEIYGEVLQQMGYKIKSTSDSSPREGPTTIMYGSGQKPQAQALAGRIPGNRTITPKPESASKELIIYIR